MTYEPLAGHRVKITVETDIEADDIGSRFVLIGDRVVPVDRLARDGATFEKVEPPREPGWYAISYRGYRPECHQWDGSEWINSGSDQPLWNQDAVKVLSDRIADPS